MRLRCFAFLCKISLYFQCTCIKDIRLRIICIYYKISAYTYIVFFLFHNNSCCTITVICFPTFCINQLILYSIITFNIQRSTPDIQISIRLYQSPFNHYYTRVQLKLSFCFHIPSDKQFSTINIQHAFCLIQFSIYCQCFPI